MTRKTLFESIRLFAGLSALAIAASACAPTGVNLAEPNAAGTHQIQAQGPRIDEAVEQEIERLGESRVHIRALPAASGLSSKAVARDAGEIPPEIISLLARLPAGSFEVESNVEGQPEALGRLTREGLAALRGDAGVEFVAKDRVDELID